VKKATYQDKELIDRVARRLEMALNGASASGATAVRATCQDKELIDRVARRIEGEAIAGEASSPAGGKASNAAPQSPGVGVRTPADHASALDAADYLDAGRLDGLGRIAVDPCITIADARKFVASMVAQALHAEAYVERSALGELGYCWPAIKAAADERTRKIEKNA
jgi:hypothetical protein